MGILVLAFAIHLWMVCMQLEEQKSYVVLGKNLLNCVSLNVVLNEHCELKDR